MIQCSGSQQPDIATWSHPIRQLVYTFHSSDLWVPGLYHFVICECESVCECESMCACVLSRFLSSVYGWGKHCFFMRWSRFPIALLLRASESGLARSGSAPLTYSVFTTLLPSHTPIFHPRYLSGDDLSHWKWQSLKKKKTGTTQEFTFKGSLWREAGRSFLLVFLDETIAFPSANFLPTSTDFTVRSCQRWFH